MVKGSNSQLGEGSHMRKWEHISLGGGGAIAGEHAVSNESVLLLAFNGHSLGTSWVPGPVPQDVLGLNS